MGRALRHWQSPAAGGLAALALLTLIAPPVMVTLSAAIEAPLEPWRALFQPRLLQLLGNSLSVAAATTVACVLIGAPLGTVLARTQLPFARLALFLHSVPLTLPPFLIALTAFHLFGAGGWLGLSASPRWLFAMSGCVLVLTISLVPVVTVLTWLGVRSTDAAGDEAARLIAGSWKSLWRVVLPQATRSIALAAIVVFTLALTEVAVPMFLRVDVYSAAVFARLGGFAFAPGEAAVLAIPLAVFSFALWAFERAGPARRVVALPIGRHTAVPLIDGRGPKLFSSLAAVLVAGIGIAPVILMIVAASRGNGFALLDTYAGDSILNSVLYAASVSTITVVLATLVMSVAREFPRFVSSIDAVAWLAFLLPPALFAIGAIGFWNRPNMQWLYGSAGIVILALSARYAVLAIRIILSGQQHLSPSLDEAARTLGATYWQRLTRIQLPGLRRFAVGAWLLVFVFCLRDIETTALLYPPGGEPITVRLYTLEANGPPAVIAALAVVLALMIVAPFAVASLLLRRPA